MTPVYNGTAMEVKIQHHIRFLMMKIQTARHIILGQNIMSMVDMLVLQMMGRSIIHIHQYRPHYKIFHLEMLQS
jgi:hypothetical protein